MTVHCVYDGTLPAHDPFEELRAIEHTIDNYGDPLPEHRPSDVQAYESTTSESAETSYFHVADTLRSLQNGTYDLSELPEDLAQHTSETDQPQFNILTLRYAYITVLVQPSKDIVDDIHSGQLHSITQFVGDGSLQPVNQGSKPPTRPMVGISQFPR